MTSRASPGGALLRASRLFTLPAPLPPPQGDLSGATRFNSDTATLPHPTHQVVTTPLSSRSHGDWGLKRELPLKSTKKTTNPFIRVRQVDAVEHITDFVSAGDHGVTLRKWQEMNMPLSVPSQQSTAWYKRNQAVNSVFEESGDFTAADPAKELAAENKRWKFRGPWLAGMTEGEFKTWLEKTVRPQRSEFRRFLKEMIAAEMSQEASAEHMDDDGLGDELGEAPKIDPESISEEQLTMFLRQLRVERPKLFRLVGRFLDLAPINPPVMQLGQQLTPGLSYEVQHVGNPYAVNGPPATHPSAGLSYLRTRSFLENHPIYGPQKDHAPVEARVLKPKTQSFAGQHVMLGVGGFVAHGPGGESSSNNAHNRENSGLMQFKPEIEGGAKLWVRPASASISSSGRVQLTVDDASRESVAVAKELTGGKPVYGQERQHLQENDFNLEDFKKAATGSKEPLMGSMDSYGLRP